MKNEYGIVEGLKKLRDLKPRHLRLGREMFSGAVYPMDFLAAAVLNRSLALSFGFASLVEQQNFISAAPLLRFQLDNTLRFYATTLVDKPHDFSLEVLAGQQIDKMKDKSGHPLRDKFLLDSLVADTRLNIDRSWLPSVYKQTSGYVHFSEKHMHNALQINADNGISFRGKISEKDAYVTEELYDEAIEAMIEATNLCLQIVEYWVLQKNHQAPAAVP